MIRLIAARIMSDLLKRKETFQGPNDTRLQKLSAQEKSKAAAMIWGTCRYFPRYQALLTQCLKKSFKPKDSDMSALVYLGWYQLEYMRMPAHAVVNETVETARALKKAWACGVLNALLRQWPVKPEHSNKVIELAHPLWLIKAIEQDWPVQAASIFAANNTQAPMHLRIHARYDTALNYQSSLENKSMLSDPLEGLPQGLMLHSPNDVFALPGFKEGRVSVQDASAQWVSQLLPKQTPLRVLDACAAPGGKTAAILEQCPCVVKMVALENNPSRFKRLQETLQRCQVEAECIETDATAVKQWWDGDLFDVIILDAPCSGTGVIRRHPDIKVQRTPEEVNELITLQQSLLSHLWPCLKPGGLLLYITCSVLKRENEDQLAWFCEAHKEAIAADLALPWPKLQYGYQTLPDAHNHGDGFYYAGILKGTVS